MLMINRCHQQPEIKRSPSQHSAFAFLHVVKMKKSCEDIVFLLVLVNAKIAPLFD